ncbi:hypothetical protein N8072_00580 [bacterium]|nr:hypothetical protein [bacterium]MDC1257157.1 hypothetical protein [bacterium]
MINNMPAYIVTNACLTGLHTSKVLTKKEYVSAQEIWGQQAFVVAPFSETLYNKLYAQFTQSKEFIHNLIPKMNTPQYIAAHAKFYKKVTNNV